MRWTEQLFEEKLKELHPDLKLISDFITLRGYIAVIDSDGVIYKTRGQNLLKSKPSIKSAVNKTHAFIVMSKKVHGDKYDYSNVVFINANIKVKIICPIHGEFEQIASNHVHMGYGCPKCGNMWALTKESWINCTKDKKCIFYIISCYNEEEYFIKFGITSRSVEARFFKEEYMPYKYESVFEFISSGENIWELEKYMENYYYKYKYIPKIKFGGRTECYDFSILEESIKTLTKEISNNYGEKS